MIETVAVNGTPGRLGELRLQDFLQGFFFGAGFFETFLIQEGAPMFLEEHLERLRASLRAHAESVGAPPEELLSPAAVRQALARCLEADAELGADFTGVGKLTASDGKLLLSFRPLPANHERNQTEGVDIEAVEGTCYRRGDGTLNHKSLSYFRQYPHMGRMPVFTNERGELCETPTGNLFFLLEDADAVVTPPLHAPCLPGIIRAELLREGRLGARRVLERDVTGDLVGALRGCFVTNSVGLAMPVRKFLGRPLTESVELARRARELVLQRAARRDPAWLAG